MRRLGEDGFTAIEMVVVGAFFLVIVIPGLFLVHPVDNSSALRNAERQVAVDYIVQRIHVYIAQTGGLPSDITNQMTQIGTGTGHVDLCKDLAPIGLKSFYADPFFGSFVNCKTEADSYITGLGIQKTNTTSNKVTVAALGSEGKIVYITD